jgi:hypothetical protein
MFHSNNQIAIPDISKVRNHIKVSESSKLDRGTDLGSVSVWNSICGFWGFGGDLIVVQIFVAVVTIRGLSYSTAMFTWSVSSGALNRISHF